MKKLITIITILTLFAVTGIKVEAAKSKQTNNIFASSRVDLRAKALQNVLEKRNSPLAPYAGYYVNAADRNGIDWRLLPAIAGLESSFGLRQMPGSHNSYGWGGGHIYFDSVEDGIDTILIAFKNKYAARGAKTVEQIGPIYAESPTWVPRVRSFMNKFEAEYARLGMHSLELTI